MRRAQRVAAAWATKRKQAADRPLTARGPAWLRLAADGKGFIPIAGRAAVVQRIFEESADGVGANLIARRLNEEGVGPFGRSQGWHGSYVKKILANEAVIGILQPHSFQEGVRQPDGPPIHGYYPAIIDEALFERARQAIRERFVGVTGQRHRTCANLLRGLAHCAICGGPMHHTDKGHGGRQSLQCDSAKRHAGCDSRRRWSYPEVERSVVDLLGEAEDGLDGLAALPPEERFVARTALAERLRQGLQRILFFPQGTIAAILAGGGDIRLIQIGPEPIATRSEAPTPSRALHRRG